MKTYLPLATALLFNVAVAEEADLCYDSAISQADLNRCAAEESRRTELRLDQLVSELRRELPEQPEQKLTAAQRAWQAMTEHDCGIASWYLRGGSARSMMVSIYYTEHRKLRIQTLSAMLCHPMKDQCEAMEKYRGQR